MAESEWCLLMPAEDLGREKSKVAKTPCYEPHLVDGLSVGCAELGPRVRMAGYSGWLREICALTLLPTLVGSSQVRWWTRGKSAPNRLGEQPLAGARTMRGWWRSGSRTTEGFGPRRPWRAPPRLPCAASNSGCPRGMMIADQALALFRWVPDVMVSGILLRR